MTLKPEGLHEATGSIFPSQLLRQGQWASVGSDSRSARALATGSRAVRPPARGVRIPSPPHRLSADPVPKDSHTLALHRDKRKHLVTLPVAATKNGIPPTPQNLSSLLVPGPGLAPERGHSPLRECKGCGTRERLGPGHRSSPLPGLVAGGPGRTSSSSFRSSLPAVSSRQTSLIRILASFPI